MKCECMEFELPEGQLGVQLGEYLFFNFAFISSCLGIPYDFFDFIVLL